jgi:hypothetical protein
MSMKGTLQPDHILNNKYEFKVGGFAITIVEASETSQSIKAVELPDDTASPSGRKSTSELTISVPAHHDVDVKFMNQWWTACSGKQLADRKRPCILTAFSGTEASNYTLLLDGVWPSEKTTGSLEMSGGGTMHVIKYKLSIDDVNEL